MTVEEKFGKEVMEKWLTEEAITTAFYQYVKEDGAWVSLLSLK